MRVFWIGLGGAAGTIARYFVSGWALDRFGPGFPFGTLAVNVGGSFLLAVLMYLGTEAGMLPPTARLALTTGAMGGFTTYSTFSYETMRYLQDGAWGLALLNMSVTLVACLLACLLGWVAAQWLAGAAT